MKNITWVDLETTGLDRDAHTIIEIAIVTTDWKGNILDQWATKIRPTPKELAQASPKALEINGYTEKNWVDAMSPKEALVEIENRLRNSSIMGGQNIGGFDVPFLNSWLKKRGSGVRAGRRSIDTMTLIIEHLFPCGQTSASLVNARKALSIETGVAHTALADILATIEVYKKLRCSTFLDRLWWKWIIPRRMK